MNERIEKQFQQLAEDLKKQVRSIIDNRLQSLEESVKEEVQSINELHFQELTQDLKDRAKAIDDAKEYIENMNFGEGGIYCKEGKLTVDRDNRLVHVNLFGNETSYIYPLDRVWNEHIVKAFGIAKRFNDDDGARKFCEDVPQPKTFAEGMTLLVSRKPVFVDRFWKSPHSTGVVSSLNPKTITIDFHNEGIEKFEDKFLIVSDTLVEYNTKQTGSKRALHNKP